MYTVNLNELDTLLVLTACLPHPIMRPFIMRTFDKNVDVECCCLKLSVHSSCAHCISVVDSKLNSKFPGNFFCTTFKEAWQNIIF